MTVKKGERGKAVCRHPLGGLIEGREYDLIGKGGNPPWVAVFEGGRQLCIAYLWRFQ
jgi:hypothetical protein